MPNIYLRQGDANLNNIVLRDPTMPDVVARNCALAITEALDTAAMTVAGGINSSLAVTEAKDAPVMTVTAKVNCALTVVEAKDILALQVKAIAAAILAATEAKDTAALTAAVKVNSFLAVTEQSDVVSISARVAIQTLLAATESPDIVAIQAQIKPAEQQQPVQPFYGAGSGYALPEPIWKPVEAKLAVTEAPDKVVIYMSVFDVGAERIKKIKKQQYEEDEIFTFLMAA